MALDDVSILDPDYVLAAAEAVGAVIAATASVLAETDALNTVGTNATLGVWLGVFGLVLLVASMQLARGAVRRVGLA